MELAVLFPVFLILLFGVVQVAQWYHMRSLCLAAANAGAETGRQAGATDTDARTTAAGFLTRAGALPNAAIDTAGSTATVVRVEVTAPVPHVLPLPGLSMTVTQSAQRQRERFTTPEPVR